MSAVRFVVAPLALAIAVGSASAVAYEKGDIIVRTGAVTVDPREDSQEIYSATGSYPGSGLALFAGLDSDTQLGLSFTYMLNSNWGVELLAATPFEHDISLESKIAGNVLKRAATTKHLPPTLSLQWYPLGGEAKVQPYVGLGVNYTLFFEEDMSTDFDCATNASGCADTDVDLDASFGLAAQLGVDWPITERIALNAAVWWIDIDTEASIKSPGADLAPVGPWDTQTKFDVDVDPWVYMIGIAYKF